jgi:hypothetical protein
MTGKLPFFYLKDMSVIKFVQDGKRPDRLKYLPAVFSDSMWEILVSCWDADPKRRLDIGSVIERLMNLRSGWFYIRRGLPKGNVNYFSLKSRLYNTKCIHTVGVNAVFDVTSVIIWSWLLLELGMQYGIYKAVTKNDHDRRTYMRSGDGMLCFA